MDKKSQIEKNIEKFDEEITNKKKLTEETKKNLVHKSFENLIYFMIIMAYLIFINIISANLDTDIFINIIKVSSFVWLLVSIIMFEISYKKDNDSLLVHAIEILSIAIVTLFLISGYKLYYDKFSLVVVTTIAVYIIFYIFKILFIMIRTKIKHNKNLSDINDIIKNK